MQRVDEVMMESGWKSNSTVEISPNCPRCGSCNTKFCYYNNYSLTQPRYFCKACRRYWTRGGSLRNVPVGGGCRKSRRGNSKTSSSMHPPSRFLTDDAHNNFDPTKNNPSSSTSCDAPNIDLALVYANYLNQKPEPDHSKAYDDDDACVSMEYNYNYSSDHGPSTQVSTGTAGCLTESQLSSEESKQMYFYGSMCMQKNEEEGLIEQQYCSSGSCSDVHSMNFELPPLPGEEGCAGLHDDGDHMMWSSNNSAFHSTHPPSQPFDADLLISDWTHFDFPRP